MTKYFQYIQKFWDRLGCVSKLNVNLKLKTHIFTNFMFCNCNRNQIFDQNLYRIKYFWLLKYNFNTIVLIHLKILKQAMFHILQNHETQKCPPFAGPYFIKKTAEVCKYDVKLNSTQTVCTVRRCLTSKFHQESIL